MIIFFNCIAVCVIREEKKWIIVIVDEDYFRLFLEAKMGICQNYGGVGSQYGGVGRIGPYYSSFSFLVPIKTNRPSPWYSTPVTYSLVCQRIEFHFAFPIHSMFPHLISTPARPNLKVGPSPNTSLLLLQNPLALSGIKIEWNKKCHRETEPLIQRPHSSIAFYHSSLFFY